MAFGSDIAHPKLQINFIFITSVFIDVLVPNCCPKRVFLTVWDNDFSKYGHFNYIYHPEFPVSWDKLRRRPMFTGSVVPRGHLGQCKSPYLTKGVRYNALRVSALLSCGLSHGKLQSTEVTELQS